MRMIAKDKLIFALDVDDFEKAQQWVAELKDHVGVFKVGKQLFTRCGPDVVRMITACGGQVFLDLKYHDIPNTVAKASVEACKLGVRMFNVHALGGAAMMEQTVKEVDAYCAETGSERPVLLAVTILTSSTEETLRGVGIDYAVEDMVVRLARLAKASGFDGVVASPREIEMIRAACGPDFVIITPGVRPASASLDDQKRVMTPAEAIAAGATGLVVGRPISAAQNPCQAATDILNEIDGALND